MLKRDVQAPYCRQIARRDLPGVTLCPDFLYTHPFMCFHLPSYGRTRGLD